jgi:diphthamide synthase (EF-2-diphthine--ammonia ligase)
VELPWPCSNAEYEARTRALCERATGEAIEAIAFGDLFLEDIRQYRIRQMQEACLEPLFPVWGIPTAELGRQMIREGVKARLTCIDPTKLDASFAGRDYDDALLDSLPASADPCGENGEFHTFVYDAPVFSHPIAIRGGEVVARDGFVFADVLPV